MIHNEELYPWILFGEEKYLLADYQSMYLTLFNSITDAIDILKLAQQSSEEQCISAEEPVITFLKESETNDHDEKPSDTE